MTTANLSLGLKTDSARAELFAFKALMQQELRGTTVSIDQGSISAGLKAAAAQGIKLGVDEAALRADVSTALRGAFAVRHRVQIDTGALEADIKSAMTKGSVGVKAGSSAVPVDALRSTVSQVLLPAVDQLAKAAITLNRAAGAAGVRQAGSGGALRASESTSVVDATSGRRRTVTQTLSDPKAVLAAVDEARQLQGVAKALDAAFTEIQALRAKSATTIDVRTLLGLPTEAQTAKASAEVFKDMMGAQRGLDVALSEIAAMRASSASRVDARTLLGLPTAAQTAKASAEVFKEAMDARRGLDVALSEITSLRAKSATAVDARTLLGLPALSSTNSAKASASVFKESLDAADAAQKAHAKLEASLKPVASASKLAAEAARDSALGHRAMTEAMNDAHSAARGLAGSVGALWVTWGNTAAIVGAAAIGAAMRSTFTVGKDLEYQLRFVQVLSNGATVSMNDFGNAVRGSLTTPREAAEAMRALAQNGLGVQEALAALPTVLSLATAGEMSLSEAALGATGVMEAFGLRVNDLGRISDVFAKAAAISNTSVTGMVDAMKQASTVSDMYHVSLEETAAALSIMAKRNIEGTAAGTAFRNMWVELATPTRKASEAMAALGLNVYDSNKQLIGADDVLGKLHNSLAALDEQSRLTALNDIFGERGAKAANAILSDIEAYRKNLREIKDESKDFTKSVVDALNDTVQGKLKALVSEFQLTTASAFNESSDAVKNFIDTLRLAAGSNELATALKTITEGVINLTTFLVQHGSTVLATFAIWKGTQWLLAARASFMALRAELALTTTALEAEAVAARTAQAAVTGGLSLIVTLGIEYLLLSDRTDQATASQNAYNNSLLQESQRLRTAEKSSAERLALLQRQIDYQKQGLSLADARDRAEKETAKFSAKNTAEQIEVVRARRDADIAELAKKEAEGKGWAKRGFSTPDKLMDEITSLRARVKAEDETVVNLRLVHNDALLAANQQNLENEADFVGKRLEQIRTFNQKVQDAVRSQPTLGKKLSPLLIGDDAPQGRDEFDKYLKQHNSDFNANAVHLPPRNVKDHSESERDKLRRAQDAFDKSLVALDKTRADLTVQNKRDEISQLIELNQYEYETGLSPYGAYLTRRRELTEQDRKFTEATAEGLAKDLRQLADKKAIDYFLSPEKDKDDLLNMQAAVNDSERAALDAEAKAAKARTDNTRTRLNEPAAIAKSIRDTAQAARDQQLDDLLPGSTKESKLATKAAEMRAELAIYREGSAERIALEKQVAQYVEITQQKITNDSLQLWVDSLNGSLRTAAEGFAGMVKGVEALMAIERNRQDQADQFALERKGAKGDQSALTEIAKREQASIKQTERQQVSAYASMAAEGKKFFKEQTAGYKLLQGAEQGLRVYQLIMSSQALAADLASITGRVTAWVLGEQVMTTESTLGSSTRATAAVAEGQAKAVAAVASQGSGDPYSAFPRIAAMAAIMAGLGFAISASSGGGSSKTDAKAIQAAQGTGTVFGNSSAKSESLTKALDHLSSVATPQLRYTSQMAASLRNIESSLTGVAVQILRGSTDLTGKNFEGSVKVNSALGSFKITPLDGAIRRALFGSTSISLQDSGIQFNAQSLSNALGGVSASGYQVVQKNKKSLFGLVKSSSTSTQYQALDAGVQDQLTAVIRSVYNSVLVAGQALGDTSESLTSKLAGFTVNLGRISLKGLTGDQIQEQLNSVFGAFGDKLALAANSSFTGFQKVGEGYYETLVRVASGLESAKSYTDRLGLSLISLSDVSNKQGDVTAELVRQSILAKESLNGIGDIIDTYSGTASEISDAYRALRDARSALVGLGNSSVQVTRDLILGAGDMDALTSGLSDFQDKFYSAGESISIKAAKLKTEFDNLGVAMPASREAFRNLLNGIDGSTASGQKLYGSLVVLSSAFSDLVDATKQVDDSRIEMQIALLKAQGKDEAALALERQKQLDQTDPLLKALQQQVWMAQDLADKLNKLKDAGKTLSDFIDSLTAKATGTPTLQSTRAAYLSNLGLARQDDVDALAKTTTVAQAYLDAAKRSAHTQYEYAAVIAQVKSELSALNATKVYLQTSQATTASTSAVSNSAFEAYVENLMNHQQQTPSSTDVELFTSDITAKLEEIRVESKAANTTANIALIKVQKILDRWEADRLAAITTP